MHDDDDDDDDAARVIDMHGSQLKVKDIKSKHARNNRRCTKQHDHLSSARKIN